MNEHIEVRFVRKSGARLRVARQTPDGIEFEESDPIERTVGIQLKGRGAATQERMRRIAQVKGWQLGEFRLSVSVERGNLLLRGEDPDSLPQGLYDLRVQLEEAKTVQETRAVKVPQDGGDALTVAIVTDDRTLAVDLTSCDNNIQRVLADSTIDGLVGANWVKTASRRPARRACLLNLLASLRSRPALFDVLIDQVQHVYHVSNDRAFAKVDRKMLPRLEDLAKDPKRPFYREGKPKAKIHGRLLDSIPADEREGFKGLLSFRGEGGPSLQMVLAVPPTGSPHTYAEFDLDLGNALQDLLGFVVHMGELLDGKSTNHLDLRKKLAKTKAGQFLYYQVV